MGSSSSTLCNCVFCKFENTLRDRAWCNLQHSHEKPSWTYQCLFLLLKVQNTGNSSVYTWWWLWGEKNERADPETVACTADSHRGGLCRDKDWARWAALMADTDKGLILDSLAFNPWHNPSLNTPNADTCSFFHFLSQSLSLVSVGQLNWVTQQSD